MKPFDLRLLKHATSARKAFILGAFFGLVRAGAMILWCWALALLLALAVAPVLGGEKLGQVLKHLPAAASAPLLLLLAVLALTVRAASSYLLSVTSARAAIAVKTQLRAWALGKLDKASSLVLTAGGKSASRLATVLGHGLDALDSYFANYLPQLLLTAVATPVLVLAVFMADPLSAVIVLIVFPIIPVFMVLIGLTTKKVQQAQWRKLGELSSSFLDIVSGLATLKIFGRERLQEGNIRRSSEAYSKSTMQVLRVSFLSGFVLDLAGTFSIALVAVTVGTRLVSGDFSLVLGLFVLLLLPEVFVPIRQVGVAFHASTEGLAAADELFQLAAEAEQATGGVLGSAGVAGAADLAAISCENLEITHAGSAQKIGPLSFAVQPGELAVLTGASGSGKTSILGCLLGFIPATKSSVAQFSGIAQFSGTARLLGVPAWAGQQNKLFAGTVASNVALGVGLAASVNPEVSSLHQAELAQRVLGVLAEVGLGQLDPQFMLESSGASLSGGQAQRVALARALFLADLIPQAVLLLDEPTSHLDAQSEQLVIAAVVDRVRRGQAALVATHRTNWEREADKVLQLARVGNRSQLLGESANG